MNTLFPEAMNALGFKFQIGDIVVPRGTCELNPSETHRYRVTERLASESSGGVQLLYGLRAFGPDGGLAGQGLMVEEVMLEASEPFRCPEPKSRREVVRPKE